LTQHSLALRSLPVISIATITRQARSRLVVDLRLSHTPRYPLQRSATSL